MLVEKEQVATAVFYYITPRPNSLIEFILSGVDAARLADVERRFIELVHEAAYNDLDMPYMTDCLLQERRRQMFQAENSPDFFPSGAIGTVLFSKSRDLEYLSHLREFDDLNGWSERQWANFMKEWLADAKRITILGKPSAALAESLRVEEERRVASQVEKLGETGLKKLKDKLQEAKDLNERPIPEGMLEKYAIPPTDTIPFVFTTPARSGLARELGTLNNHIQQVIDAESSDLALFIQFEHIPSNFVHLNVLINTSEMPVSLRPLLTLYLENFFNTPIMQDGRRIEFEEVVKYLDRETVGYQIASAGDMGNSQILRIALTVEREKYSTAIKAVKDLLWNSIFDVERLMSSTARMLTDVPEEKRSGSSMVYSTSAMANEAPGSLPRARDTLVKALYLKKVKKLLKSNPDEVVRQMEQIRHALCQTSSFRILVIADVERLDHPVQSWELLTKDRPWKQPLAPLENRLSKLSEAGRNPGNMSYVIPLSTSDSSYALAVGKGPDSHKDPNVPALTVAIAYLDAVEGPLWDAVRGTGLAYGTSFRWRYGNTEFSVYRSPDTYKAFAASKHVIEGYASGATKFDLLALEGAISSIVLSIANAQATVVEAAADNFMNEIIRGMPRDWNEIFLSKVRNATVEDIRQVLNSIILPLFQPASTNLMVTCSPVMEEV